MIISVHRSFFGTKRRRRFLEQHDGGGDGVLLVRLATDARERVLLPLNRSDRPHLPRLDENAPVRNDHVLPLTGGLDAQSPHRGQLAVLRREGDLPNTAALHAHLEVRRRLRPHVRDRHGGAEPAVPALLVRRVVNALPLVLRSHGADGGRGGLFSGVIVGTLLARLEVSLPFIQHTSITEE